MVASLHRIVASRSERLANRGTRPVLIRIYYWNLLLSILLLLSPLPSGSTDNGASSSHFRVAGHSGGRLGGRRKNWTPIGGGEGDQRAPRTRVHPQTTLSGRRPRAARSAARDHRLLPPQPAHQRRNPGLEPGLHASPERRRLRRERGTRLLLQPLLRGTCRPHSARAGISHPRTLRSGANLHSAEPGAEGAPGVGRRWNRRLPGADGGCLSKAGAGTRPGQGPSGAGGAEGLSDLRHGAQCRRAGHGDRRQDRDRRRWSPRPEPWMVRRHRSPGPRRSGGRDLPPAGQRSRCRPAGARLLSRRKPTRAGERTLADRRALLDPDRKGPHGNPIGAADHQPRWTGRRMASGSLQEPR